MSEEQSKFQKDFPDLFSKESALSVKARDESERFLMDYELECRKAEKLESQVRCAKNELYETKKFLKDALGWQPGDKNRLHIEGLEKRLNNIRMQYGKTRKENEMLRDHIQIVRRDASGAHRELTSLSNNLQKLESKTSDLRQFSKSNDKITSTQKVKMERLNASFTQERVSRHGKVSKLEEIFKNESFSVTPTAYNRPRTPYIELSDNMKALKFISNKWASKVKRKEKDIQYYRDNIQELEDGFEVMKNIISNKSLTTTVKAFTDSCEQEKDLRSTYLRLSEKIEILERNIEKTRTKIKEISENFENKQLDKQNFLKKLEKDIAKIQTEEAKLIFSKTTHENSIENISSTILRLLNSLESFEVKALSFQIIEDPSLNSTNVIIHLNKLEELIDLFLKGAEMNYTTFFEPREEKFESKLVLNAIDIEEMPVEDTLYPLTLEEIREQAKTFLNSLS